MKAILIRSQNHPRPEITSKIFSTKQEAFAGMKQDIIDHLKADPHCNDKTPKDYVQLMESGIEFSNMKMQQDTAYLYTNFGETWYLWRIIEV